MIVNMIISLIQILKMLYLWRKEFKMKNKNIFPSFNSLKCKKTKFFLKTPILILSNIISTYGLFWAEVGTRQHCSDNVTMFSGQQMVIMALWPYSLWFLHISRQRGIINFFLIFFLVSVEWLVFFYRSQVFFRRLRLRPEPQLQFRVFSF